MSADWSSGPGLPQTHRDGRTHLKTRKSCKSCLLILFLSHTQETPGQESLPDPGREGAGSSQHWARALLLLRGNLRLLEGDGLPSSLPGDRESSEFWIRVLTPPRGYWSLRLFRPLPWASDAISEAQGWNGLC